MFGESKCEDSGTYTGSALIVEELQHRVVNEYAMLAASVNLRARSFAGPTRAILLETSSRLCEFAEIHRALLMPRNPGAVELGEYLRTLCLALSRACLAERGLCLLLRETSVRVAADRAWRVGLIVSELITNAVKHGTWNEAGIIEVEILSSASNVYCRVSDNGGGSGGLSAGRGTDIVTAIAQELGGNLYRETDERGVTILLIFPHSPEASAWT
jgi:two-component sensor histidine kinase